MKTFKEFSMTEKVKWDEYDTPYGGRHGKEFDKRLPWKKEKEKYKKLQKSASLKKESIVEFDSPTIYCDMDGVLADFVKFTSTHLGHPFKDEYWKDLPDDLFYQLPLMPDAKKLYDLFLEAMAHMQETARNNAVPESKIDLPKLKRQDG